MKKHNINAEPVAMVCDHFLFSVPMSMTEMRHMRTLMTRLVKLFFSNMEIMNANAIALKMVRIQTSELNGSKNADTSVSRRRISEKHSCMFDAAVENRNTMPCAKRVAANFVARKAALTSVVLHFIVPRNTTFGISEFNLETRKVSIEHAAPLSPQVSFEAFTCQKMILSKSSTQTNFLARFRCQTKVVTENGGSLLTWSNT